MNIFNLLSRLFGSKKTHQTTPSFNPHVPEVETKDIRPKGRMACQDSITHLDNLIVACLKEEHAKGNTDVFFILSRKESLIKLFLNRRVLRLNEDLSKNSLTDEELNEEWEDFYSHNGDRLNVRTVGKLVHSEGEQIVRVTGGFQEPMCINSNDKETEYRLGENTSCFFHEIPDTIEDVTIISPTAIQKFIESLPDNNHIKRLYKSGTIPDQEIAAMIVGLGYKTDIDPAIFKSPVEGILNNPSFEDYKPFPVLSKDNKK